MIFAPRFLQGLTCSLLLLMASGCTEVAVASDADIVIAVNGQGAVYSEPDVLRLQLYVEERGEVATKLEQQVTHTTGQILGFLLEQGIAEKDLQALQVNLAPWIEYQQQQQVHRGFIFSRRISVNVRDLASYPRILDGIMKLGVSRIDGLSFETSDADKHYLQALELALEDARLKARKMAAAMGIKLGAVVSIYETSSPVMPKSAMAPMRMQAEQVSMMPGQIDTQARVDVRFAIEQ